MFSYTLVNIVPIASNIPSSLIPSTKLLIKSAKPPTKLATISTNPVNPLVKGANIIPNNSKASPTIFTTEPKALNTAFTALNTVSLTLNSSVNFLKFLDKATNFSPVIAGTISLKPDAAAFTILTNPLRILVKPAITSSLPPFSFQNLNIAFLASVEGPIKSLKALLRLVNTSGASSKSPIIYSQVVAQPD